VTGQTTVVYQCWWSRGRVFTGGLFLPSCSRKAIAFSRLSILLAWNPKATCSLKYRQFDQTSGTCFWWVFRFQASIKSTAC
jgi:hypothetical protein